MRNQLYFFTVKHGNISCLKFPIAFDSINTGCSIVVCSVRMKIKCGHILFNLSFHKHGFSYHLKKWWGCWGEWNVTWATARHSQGAFFTWKAFVNPGKDQQFLFDVCRCSAESTKTIQPWWFRAEMTLARWIGGLWDYF